MKNAAPISILLAFAVAYCAFGRAEGPPHYPDHARLLVYRDAAGREHPVKTPEEWAVRRRHILEGMQAVMGPLPDRSKLPPLDVRIVEEVKGEGFVRETITFLAEGAERVPAYLFLPSRRPSAGRLPAMLALHQTQPLGKAAAENDYALGSLARRGYVIIAPDYPRFGDYQKFRMDGYASTTMKGIFNHMRAVDVLVSREEVDPGRIGVIGHSLGGYNALFVGAFDERLKVIVASCGWTPFHRYHGGHIKPWASHHHMPLLETKYKLDLASVPFDLPEVVAALAPRAFFSNSPSGDYLSAGVEEVIPDVRAVYALFGAADQLQVRCPDAAHGFPDAVRREAYEFVDRVLAHRPPPGKSG